MCLEGTIDVMQGKQKEFGGKCEATSRGEVSRVVVPSTLLFGAGVGKSRAMGKQGEAGWPADRKH
jgi:hypothetical protein